MKRREEVKFDILAKSRPQYNALDGKIHLDKFRPSFALITDSKCRASFLKMWPG
jgi:hypothetical protein